LIFDDDKLHTDSFPEQFTCVWYDPVLYVHEVTIEALQSLWATILSCQLRGAQIDPSSVQCH